MSGCFATLRTVTHQAPLSMRFPKQEYWSGLPFPSPRDLPNPGIQAASPVYICLYLSICIWLEQEKFTVSEFWMLEVWDQGGQGGFLPRPFSLACWRPSSSCVFTWSVLCVCASYRPFLQGHQSCWMTAHPNYFIYLSLPSKDRISKYSHILRY